MGDLAKGTTANYRTGWAHWLLWTLLRKKPPFPPGDDPFSVRLYEEELLGWGVWEFSVMQNSAGTVKGKWMAVRLTRPKTAVWIHLTSENIDYIRKAAQHEHEVGEVKREHPAAKLSKEIRDQKKSGMKGEYLDVMNKSSGKIIKAWIKNNKIVTYKSILSLALIIGGLIGITFK